MKTLVDFDGSWPSFVSLNRPQHLGLAVQMCFLDRPFYINQSNTKNTNEIPYAGYWIYQGDNKILVTPFQSFASRNLQTSSLLFFRGRYINTLSCRLPTTFSRWHFLSPLSSFWHLRRLVWFVNSLWMAHFPLLSVSLLKPKFTYCDGSRDTFNSAKQNITARLKMDRSHSRSDERCMSWPCLHTHNCLLRSFSTAQVFIEIK